jgi:glycerol-3-phosphate O-acyltransferase/dihydroxyacetone phosphate acyltransferase
MTWLDERLFGWSRSAKRGTSAWGGGSEHPSRAVTPSISDDEETGDYDDVIGLLSPPEEQLSNTGNPRSRQSSYADLQRLRMAPLGQIQTSQTPLDMSTADNNSPTQLRVRNRKPSLSHGVTVSRISAEDPNEEFPQATQKLNEEKTK